MFQQQRPIGGTKPATLPAPTPVKPQTVPDKSPLPTPTPTKPVERPRPDKIPVCPPDVCPIKE